MKAEATCYMAKSPEGVIAVSAGGFCSTYDARRAIEKINAPDLTWKQMYRHGWRIVRVDVGEI